MIRTRSTVRSPLAAGALALALILAGCGSSADDATDTSTESTEAATDTTAAATETTEAATDTTEATEAATETSEAAAPAEGTPVELVEWEIVLDGTVAAGSNTFAISNPGENPHALAIVKGDSYEALPLLDNGAVDIESMEATDVIGSTENIESGAVGTLTVDLEPGNYVFFCPIAFGPNSHAKAGQVLPVTVS